MKNFKILIGIILVPVAILVWYEVFRLIMMELGGSGQSFESSVVLNGVNQFTSEMGGGKGLAMPIILVGLLTIVFILMKGSRNRDNRKL